MSQIVAYEGVVMDDDHRKCREEATDGEMMNLEDFLTKVGVVDDQDPDNNDDIKMLMLFAWRLNSDIFNFDPIARTLLKALS
ncbi:hypothetical protein JHK82_018976 [Glycine max]|nr:hypothetical protein JHK82_018976 [Glycine max]